MGGCTSQPIVASSNKSIDSTLKAAQQENASTIRLLLLGTGESGKSTIFKQIKIIHDSGYSDEERAQFVPAIHENVVHNIQALINACGPEHLDVPFPEQLEADAQAVQVLAQSEHIIIDLEMASVIDRLWLSKEIQIAFAKKSQFYVGDSAQYFFDSLDRISAQHYVPSDLDILHTRARTTGIVRKPFTQKGLKFELVDVGGQRTDRRKWIHCFEGVKAVLFVASLCDYDGILVEDGQTNRMIEAMNVFDDICQSRFFSEAAIILFLNKSDLFREKIKVANITSAFPSYAGPQEYEGASEFILNEFQNLALAAGAGPRLYPHITCATNTQNIKSVLTAVGDLMLSSSLRNSGFL